MTRFRSSLIMSLAVFITIAPGCTSGLSVEETPTCPLPLESHLRNYFPLAVNDTHTFSFVSGNRGGGAAIGEERTAGTLTWTVIKESDCQDGEIQYNIREEFEGIHQTLVYAREEEGWRDGDPAQWTKSLTFSLSDSLDMGAYTIRSVAWAYPTSTPDTIVIIQSTEGYPPHGPDVTLTLVRDEGLVSRSYSRYLGLGGGENYNEMSKISDH